MSEFSYQEKARLLVREQMKRYEDGSEGRICLACSHVNDANALFCEECGFKFESEDKACPVCGEMVTGLYCPLCGAKTDGTACPSCGAVAYSDFCMECGTPVTEFGKKVMTPDPAAPVVKERIPDAEAEKIRNEMLSGLTAESKKEIERSRQRIIILKEREYEAARDSRIAAYNDALGAKVKIVGSSDLAAVRRAVERLRSSVLAETERVDTVVRKREEEEAARKKAEEERKRRQEMINGTWLHSASWGYCLMKFNCNDTVISGTTFLDCPKGQNLNKISGTFDGEIISFYVSGCSGNECENHAIMKFSGRLSGGLLSGYMHFMSEVEQGIFVRNG